MRRWYIGVQAGRREADPGARRGKGRHAEDDMAQVLCEVSEGLRKSEATVKLTTYDDRPEFLPVDRGLLTEEGGRWYLSVGLIHLSHEKKAALVSLPVEADSGAHRVWVRLEHVKQERSAQ
jgi:hypothetical protein